MKWKDGSDPFLNLGSIFENTGQLEVPWLFRRVNRCLQTHFICYWHWKYLIWELSIFFVSIFFPEFLFLYGGVNLSDDLIFNVTIVLFKILFSFIDWSIFFLVDCPFS